MRMLATLPLLAFALGSLAARADDKVRPHFGMSFGAAQPLGDLRQDTDDQPGFAFALFLPIDYGNGHVLRPRMDMTSFDLAKTRPGSTVLSSGVAVTPASKGGSQLDRFTVGLDYVFHLRGSYGKGPYLFLGGGVGTWNVDDRHSDGDILVVQTAPGQVVPTLREFRSIPRSAGFYASGGAGWRLGRTFGLELMATRSSYRKDVLTPTALDPMASERITRQATTAQASVTWTF